MRRYTAHLRDLGIPVEAERGRYGGYRLARGYRMPPLVLINDEALAVVLGLVAAERLGMGTAVPASAGALAKIERVLPQALREPLAAIRESLAFTGNAVIGQAPGAGILLALAQAAVGIDIAVVDRGRPAASPSPVPNVTTRSPTAPPGGSRGGRPPAFDEERYKRRNVVERCFNRLKQFRGLATRYAKRAAYYQAELTIAAIVL
ncbi:hypothetical protein F4560_003094 [Saccharothrix ecbatanensis]|uniref:DDE family transposase n=1 Tax=Saccharothrix ecbatanensis TaxID=1105145 RepID=A0A7W9HJP2_9PSEU|nr:hypothetical protein [Saccharothrix ecbatanensis]